MKVQHLVAVFALVAASFAAPAMASYSSGSVLQDVESAVAGSGQIQVYVRGDAVTLTGYSDSLDAQAAARAALNVPGINHVYNHVENHNS